MEFELCLTSLALDQIVKQYMWEERFLQAEYRIYVTFTHSYTEGFLIYYKLFIVGSGSIQIHAVISVLKMSIHTHLMGR